MGKRSKSTNKEDENIKIKEKKSKNKGTKLELLEKNKDTERITVSENNETQVVSNNEDKCIKKNKSDRKHNKSLTHDSTPNKKIIFDANDNAEERITVSVSEDNETQIMSKSEDECITKKKSKRKHNKSLTNDNTPNKKIIFDDNAEALEVPINKKKKQNKKGIDPKEDEPTEEDIDQFCDEINEEDNVEYENWVQLIEAKLSSNKKKT